MKNKISLLISASALAFMACSSLEVSNPEEENFPADWSVAAYLTVNPDLRAMQIKDQVTILNTKSGLASDAADETAFEAIMGDVALNYAGFTAASWDATDASKTKYVKSFNVYGVANELELFATLQLDSTAIGMQFVSYGRREGRPYRACAEGEGAIVKGDCQSTDMEGALFPTNFENHLYCSRAGVTYCIDCVASDECPVIAAPVPTPAEGEE
ncbi:hypothetical protein [Fibrobacter sp. UWEL]|uniref:hypothetical protein n=1 Tax=Fibrobacter sp. UWEL TaxID=1896209 RepID=UPI000915DACF|nr:hypothetical protein [Fibrobacter sp. UWEL]SHK76776.1 hypothetical protein SAMN05720468_106128 [Fibrobacter sp. UWEL]